MPMMICRESGLEDHLVVPRSLALDQRLSHAARGLLMDILSRPDGWEANADELSRVARQARGETRGEGRRAIRQLFAELESAGYMRRLQLRTSSGTFVTTLEVTDVPHRWCDSTIRETVPPLPRRGEGNVVYVVGDDRSGVVKIGTTSNLARRLSGLQTGSAYVLRVLWSYGGDVELESYLHERFASLRMQGEWFDFGEADPVTEVSAATERYYLVPTGTCASWS